MSKSPTNGKPSSLTSIAFNTGVITERERILAWLKKQTLQSQYQGMNWTDACLLLHKNFEQQIKGENK